MTDRGEVVGTVYADTVKKIAPLPSDATLARRITDNAFDAVLETLCLEAGVTEGEKSS